MMQRSYLELAILSRVLLISCDAILEDISFRKLHCRKFAVHSGTTLQINSTSLVSVNAIIYPGHVCLLSVKGTTLWRGGCA